MIQPKRTPLFEFHKSHGAKMVNYTGWEMPVQYRGIIKEHMAVREHAGLFDVSHMGEIMVEGKDADGFLQYILTNDLTRINEFQIQYTFMCNEDGGVIDDLLVYMLNPNKYMLVVNASNVDKDHNWLEKHGQSYNINTKNISNKVALIAVQGPKSSSILKTIFNDKLDNIRPFHFLQCKLDSIDVLISRTGYTGEDGFEIYSKWADVPCIWEEIFEAGEVELAGLGARDTLRFEAGLPLYGNELSEDVTPLEARLGKFVSLEKNEFIGKEALNRQRQEGVKKTLVKFEVTDKGVARSGFSVIKNGKTIGWVTTGTYSPVFKKNIGVAYVQKEFGSEGSLIEVCRGRRKMKGKVVPWEFYKRK